MNDLWKFRGFVLSSVRMEYAVRFSRSKIGAFWMVIYPLAQVAIFALVLSKVIGSRLPASDSPYSYAIYLMAGQLAWTGFMETVSRSLNMFINQGALLKKASFPIFVLPVVEFIIGFLNSIIFFVVIVAIFAFLGHRPTWMVFLVPLLIVLTLFLAIAIGIVLGTLNVFLRGVGQLVPILLNFGFWLTPIVYVVDVLPVWLHSVLVWNPMYHIVVAFHDVLVFQRDPQWFELSVVAGFAAMVMALAIRMIHKASPEMADVL